MEMRPLQVKLRGHNERRSSSDQRLVEVQLTETDYIRIDNTATVIESRFLANLFLDIPHRDFTEPSRFQDTLVRSLSGVMDLDRDYFLDFVIPNTVSFAYNTGFSTVKMVIDLVNIKTVCDGDACAICLEELPVSSSSDVEIMSCGHVFHEDCAHRWLEQSDSCPLCRRARVFKFDRTNRPDNHDCGKSNRI